jgi:hypothetical protein
MESRKDREKYFGCGHSLSLIGIVLSEKVWGARNRYIGNLFFFNYIQYRPSGCRRHSVSEIDVPQGWTACPEVVLAYTSRRIDSNYPSNRSFS